MESVAAFVWNRWQLCRGSGGRIHLESVAALPWNTQPLIQSRLAKEGEVLRWCLDWLARLEQNEVVVVHIAPYGRALGTSTLASGAGSWCA